MDYLKAVTDEQIKAERFELNVGDTVRVSVKVTEGNRERIQAFEGTIIAKRGGGISETFKVRRVAYGVGVERTFLVHSPKVENVEIIRRGKVRRAKLTFLKGMVGGYRIKERGQN